MLTTALLPPSLQDNFELKQLRKNHKTLPTNIQKFIGTLKRCVRKAIKKKGGTPYSIVRSLFMYWGTGDSSPSGTVCAPPCVPCRGAAQRVSCTAGTLTNPSSALLPLPCPLQLNAEQLTKCMTSLGVVISPAAVDEVITYYSTPGTQAAGGSLKQMSYDELLLDVTADEPTVIMDTGNKYFDGDDIGVRFTEVEDAFAVKPLIVKQFIEATQNYVMTQMRVEGGTPHFHVRELFNRFDYNQSNGLDEEELQVCMCVGGMPSFDILPDPQTKLNEV